MSVWSFQDMLLHLFLNGRLGGASPFLFEGIPGYLKIKELFFPCRESTSTLFPQAPSPQWSTALPQAVSRLKRNNQPRLNIIMNPPKPSKTTYLPSTHRLLLTLRRCEKQQRNWMASKPLQGFPTNKPITNTHFIIISLSVVLVESSFSPIILTLSHWQPSLFCGLIPLPYMVLRIQQYDRILPCFSFLGAAFLAHKEKQWPKKGHWKMNGSKKDVSRSTGSRWKKIDTKR